MPDCSGRPSLTPPVLLALFSFKDSLNLLASYSIFTLATTRLSWRTLQCVLLCIIFFFWLNILVHYLFPPFSDFFVHLGKTGLLKSRYFWAPAFKMSLKLGSESGCLPRILQGFVLGSSRVYFNELPGRAFALLCFGDDRGEIKEEEDVCPGA